MSSHVSNAFASEVSALFRSAGRSWTTPPEISLSLRALLISVPLATDPDGLSPTKLDYFVSRGMEISTGLLQSPDALPSA